jgi:predicted hydrocarbon binding protein
MFGLLVEGLSRRGLLASLTSLISERGLDISYCSTTKAAREGERGRILLFVDFTDSLFTPHSIAKELESLDSIDRVRVIEPKVEGFIADASFPLIIGSARAVLLDESALKGLLLKFRERLGTGGEAMLYHIGLEVGRERWRYILRMAEEIGAGRFSDKVSIAADVFRSMGYGVMEIRELKEESPYANFEVWDCIECQLGKPSRRFFSQFVRGLLAGLTSIIYGRDMYAKETMCIAVGDPYCEFEIEPREG